VRTQILPSRWVTADGLVWGQQKLLTLAEEKGYCEVSVAVVRGTILYSESSNPCQELKVAELCCPCVLAECGQAADGAVRAAVRFAR